MTHAVITDKKMLTWKIFLPVGRCAANDNYPVDGYEELIKRDLYQMFSKQTIIRHILSEADWIRPEWIDRDDPLATLIECGKYPALDLYYFYELNVKGVRS